MPITDVSDMDISPVSCDTDDMSEQPTLARRSLGAAFRRLRETAGQSPRDVGDAIGVSRQTIGRIDAQTAFVEGIMNGISERECGLFHIEDRFLVLEPAVAKALRRKANHGEVQKLSDVIALLVQSKDGRLS